MDDNLIRSALSQETRDRLQELSRSMVPDATRKQMQAIGRSMADRLPKVDRPAATDLLSNVRVTEVPDKPVMEPDFLVDPVPVRQLAVLESINERLEAAEDQLRGVNARQGAMVAQQERGDKRDELMIKLTWLMVGVGVGTFVAAIIAALAAVVAL